LIDLFAKQEEKKKNAITIIIMTSGAWVEDHHRHYAPAS